MTFGSNDDHAIYDQIRNILTDFYPFVDYVETSLLQTRHASQTQLNHQSIFIRLFMESMSELAHHLKAAFTTE